MALLDSREQIGEFDKSNILGSIEQLPDQIRDAWDQAKTLEFPQSYSSIKNVVVSGMGGSALVSWLIKRLYHQELSIPFDVYSGYTLPGYVNQDSLVILSSYSGNTEETVSCAKKAIEKKAKIIVITAGGELAQLATRHKLPICLIDPIFNPSNQPRMAIGYAIVSQLAIFNKLGIINVAEKNIFDMVDNLRELVKKLTVDNMENNTAKLLAYRAFDKAIVFTGAEHLVGAVHVTNNQVNENAKNLTSEWHLPEFDHHYLEALSHPRKLRDDVHFMLYQSHLYTSELTKRVELTRAVIEKMGYECDVIQATAPTPLEQVFETITLGGFLSFYLSMLYKIDPAPIPNVDWFKSEMKK